MSEIVISDVSQPICLEQLWKALCNIVGLDQIANLVDAYILKIVDLCNSAKARLHIGALLLRCAPGMGITNVS